MIEPMLELLEQDDMQPNTPHPNAAKAVVQIDEKRVKAFAGEINMVIPPTVEQCWEDVVRYEKEATQAYAKQGLLLLKLKDECPHGEFESELNELGIGLRSARNAMAITKCLLSVSNSKRQTFAVLGFTKSKMVELSRLAVEAIDCLEDEELAELSELSVRNLRKEVKRLKAENERLDADRVELINQVNTVARDNSPETVHNLPAYVAQIRRETIVQTDAVNLALDVLTAHTQQLNANYEDTAARTAAMTVFHVWAGAGKAIFEQLEQLQSRFHITTNDIPTFLEDEWADIQCERTAIIEQFTAMMR